MEEITEKKERKHLITVADVCKNAGVNNLYVYNCLGGTYKMGDKMKNKLREAFEQAVNEARIKFLADLEHACNNGAVNNRNYVKKYPK